MSFTKIKNDPYIIECYKVADDPNSNDGFWVYHGLKHIEAVIDMAQKIGIQLGKTQEFIENLKIAALLHDVGYGGVKKDHELRSYEMAKEYFFKNKIDLKYKEEILDAIKHHRNSFDTGNEMSIILILADKLDIQRSRLTPEGYNIVGLR